MKTFFMIKPDGVQRNLVGEIISRVEAKGFSITKIKMMTISKELAAKVATGELSMQQALNQMN